MPLTKDGKPILYKPFVSKAKNKKYSVYVKGPNGKVKKINFGDKRYQHFKDKIGEYKSLDHNDKKRRDNYRRRVSGIKNKEGKLTYLDKNTANYWAYNTLW